jgi:protein farnesyltransferase/geranylgeranyltransferase type-1 subunit alpha
MHDKNGGLAFNKKVLEMCKVLYNLGHRTNHLLACIIDICQERHSKEAPTESLFHILQAFKVIKSIALSIYSYNLKAN